MSSEGELWQAWGGPLDGEMLTMPVGQSEIWVYRSKSTGDVVAWDRREEKPRFQDYEFLGEYKWTDPSRLGWVSKEARRHV